MNKDLLKVIGECKLFCESSKEVVECALGLCEAKTVEKSTYVDPQRGIYIISSGKIGIYHSENGKNILLNTLGVSHAFGYATLYSAEEDRYTVIKALEKTELLYIDGENVENLILADGRIALGIIKELTGKIRFLNKKLDSFVSGDLKGRLLKYIRALPYTDGRAMIPENMSALARRLGVGRASLYRLMGELIEEGVIEKNGNEIRLLEKC